MSIATRYGNLAVKHKLQLIIMATVSVVRFWPAPPSLPTTKSRARLDAE
jgi:hypothetical protein